MTELLQRSATPSVETVEVVLTPPDDLPADMSALQRAMLADAASDASRPIAAVYQ